MENTTTYFPGSWILKFVPKEDEDGHRMTYADWVLAEEDDD